MGAPATDPRFAGPSPFTRLVRVHAAAMCGDACVTVSLAGSLFFTTPTNAARGKVLLYLALTLAPFALIAPIVGPLLDRIRGGRRLMLFVSAAGRMVLAFMMSRHLKELALYPEAFGILVLGKTHAIAKSALVPALVRDRPDTDGELVEANSRLALISVIAAIAGGLPAAGINKLFHNQSYGLVIAAVVFLVGAVVALQVPKPSPEPKGRTPEEREELHLPSVVLAGSAFGVIRGVVGFYSFFVAFALKNHVFDLGVVLTASAVGGFIGVILAPVFRKAAREEIILGSALLVPAAVALFASWFGEVPVSVAAGALFLAVGAGAGRLGFDSIVQRDAPDAIRGRSFARFETRFQITWVVGGLLGLVPFHSIPFGLFCVAAVLGFFGASYLVGIRTAGATVERRRERSQRTRAAVFRELRRRFGGRREPSEPPKRPAKPRPRRTPRQPAPSAADHDAFPGGS